MVVCVRIPQVLINCDHAAERNCDPRSVVKDEGTPKFATQPWANASKIVSTAISFIGMATGQREKRSTIVNKYL